MKNICEDIMNKHNLGDIEPAGLSQVSNITHHQDGNNHNEDLFNNFDDVPLAHKSQEYHFKCNPYAYLKPYFFRINRNF